jgi:hypothetical protein
LPELFLGSWLALFPVAAEHGFSRRHSPAWPLRPGFLFDLSSLLTRRFLYPACKLNPGFVIRSKL